MLSEETVLRLMAHGMFLVCTYHWEWIPQRHTGKLVSHREVKRIKALQGKPQTFPFSQSRGIKKDFINASIPQL